MKFLNHRFFRFLSVALASFYFSMILLLSMLNVLVSCSNPKTGDETLAAEETNEIPIPKVTLSIPTIPPIEETPLYKIGKDIQTQNNDITFRKLIPSFTKTLEWKLNLRFAEVGHQILFGTKERWTALEPTQNVQEITSMPLFAASLFESFWDDQFTIIQYKQPLLGSVNKDQETPKVSTVRMGRIYWKDFISYSYLVNDRKKKAVQSYPEGSQFFPDQPLYDVTLKQGQWDEEWPSNPEDYPMEIWRIFKFKLNEPLRNIMRDLEKKYITDFTIHRYVGMLLISSTELPDFPYAGSMDEFIKYLEWQRKPDRDFLKKRVLCSLIYSKADGSIVIENGEFKKP